MYAVVLLSLAFKDIGHKFSVQISFRHDSDLFDLRRLKTKSKALSEFIREAQYADDIAIFSDTPQRLQSLLSAYNNLAKKMGLCINTVKTETMCIGVPAEFFMKEELVSRIQATSCAFGRLRKRVFESHGLPASRFSVHTQCLTPLLIYGSET